MKTRAPSFLLPQEVSEWLKLIQHLQYSMFPPFKQ